MSKNSNSSHDINSTQNEEELKRVSFQNTKIMSQEIYSELDSQGYNNNPSEQEQYPGLQIHKDPTKIPNSENYHREKIMPYKKLSELPDNVKEHLPTHAQEIYKEAFNNALKEYKNPKKRHDNSSVEILAHKVAWNAVKNKYQKDNDGEWKLK